MNYTVIKPVVGGLILGSIMFFFPFLIIKIIGFLLIVSLLFWLFRGRRAHWRRYAMVHPDKIRSMSDEDYEAYKNNFGRSHCRHRYSEYHDKKEDDTKQDKQ